MSSISSQFALRAENIVMRFGERSVLTAASLRAEAGKITVLFGRNGAGKSSLLKVAAGLSRATSGVVHFDGEAFLKPSLHRLSGRGLFFLPDRELLAPQMTIRKQFQFFAKRYSRPFIDEAAEMVGLSRQLDQRAGSCSGGERRKAEVALSWLRGPSCLLADEPYRDIAPILGETLSLVFRRMADEGCAVVLSGHDHHTLLAVADSVVWCTSGTTYELGNVTQARVHELFRKEYLGI